VRRAVLDRADQLRGRAARHSAPRPEWIEEHAREMGADDPGRYLDALVAAKKKADAVELKAAGRSGRCAALTVSANTAGALIRLSRWRWW
jgi:hypothetical protein